MKLTPVQRYDIQIFNGTYGELTFEKSIGFQKRKTKSNNQYNIKLNKDGKLFVAKNLSEDVYELFLSRITTGEIVDTIEGIVILLSDLH